MKIRCKTCGDLPMEFPEIPKSLTGVASNVTDRVGRIMRCPQCDEREVMKLVPGRPSKSAFQKQWDHPSAVRSMEASIGGNISFAIRDFRMGMAIGVSGIVKEVAETPTTVAEIGDSAAHLFGNPHPYGISTFAEFSDYFFNELGGFKGSPYESAYYDWMMQANVFFLGEEQGIQEYADKACGEDELPFLLPFDNCLFFMQNATTGAWTVSHVYRLTSFRKQWAEGPDDASALRASAIDAAIEEKGPQSLGYREWRYASDVFDAHFYMYNIRDFGKRPYFLLKEMWHLITFDIELMYGEGMRARGAIGEMPPGTSKEQAVQVQEMGMAVDTFFHIASVSAPTKYIVKVNPKMTKRDMRHAARAGRKTHQHREHYIVLDHRGVTYLNPENRGKSTPPRPHRRRAHWRRVPDRCRFLLERGIFRIPVRESIIGRDQFEDGKNHYHVLTDHEPR